MEVYAGGLKIDGSYLVITCYNNPGMFISTEPWGGLGKLEGIIIIGMSVSHSFLGGSF